MLIKYIRFVLSLSAVLLLTAAQLPDAQNMQPGLRVPAPDHSESASSAFTGVWLPLGSGTNSSVTSLAVDSSGNLYAGGRFSQAGGVDAPQFARWNGKSWAAAAAAIDGAYLTDMTVDDNGTLYVIYDSDATGTWTYYVASWNGISWDTLGEVTNGTIFELAVDSTGNLYVAGHFDQIGAVTVASIARWDGAAWSALGSGLNGPAYALTVDLDGNVYAGGSFDQAGGVPVNGIALWDGTQWSALGTGTGSVRDILLGKNGNVYVASDGGFSEWDGNAWETLYVSDHIESLAMDGNGRLFATFYEFTLCGLGYDEDPCGTYESVRIWQDQDWVVLSMVHGYIFSILYNRQDLYVAGSFSRMSGYGTIGGTGANYIARYALQSFTDVPPSHRYYQDIEILYANNMTGGCATNPLKFCPDQIMNRGQAAAFMLRGNFGPGYVPPTPTHIFQDDWTKGPWAEGWAEGMRNEGFSAGCLTSPPKYCPWDQIPREQAVIFALKLKYGKLYTPPPATGTVFADMTNPSFYATAWAEQAYKEGIIQNCGMSGGKPKFCPKNLVSRGLAAYMIVRAKGLTMP